MQDKCHGKEYKSYQPWQCKNNTITDKLNCYWGVDKVEGRTGPRIYASCKVALKNNIKIY